MTWQEVGVALVVLAALWFLARRLLGTGPKKKGSTTFVPLAQVKGGKGRTDGGCH